MARHRLRRVGASLLALSLMVTVAAACGRPNRPDEIVMWTSLAGTIDLEAQQAVIDAFERSHPQLEVRLVRKPTLPGSPHGDVTSGIAAVRGGEPPDVYLVNRFSVPQQASIGMLESLQPFIDRDGDDLMSNYLPFAVNDVTFEGEIYSLPLYTDTRALFYNKEVLRDAGIDPDVLHPRHGPPTMASVRALAERIDRVDEAGNYTRMGLIPWDGQGFYATWALARGADFFDGQACEFTPHEPAIQRTFDDLARWARELDYGRVQAFLATYRPPNAPPEQSLLYTGRVGMSIDGNWTLASIRDYAPDLDYGFTYLPVLEEGDDPHNWSGGYSLVMPTGAAHQAQAWTFMRFFTSAAGQRIYVREAGQLPTWTSLADDDVTDDYGLFADALDYTVSYMPPLPVGAAIDGALLTAQQAVLSGQETPELALDKAYDTVDRQLEAFCPLTLPDPVSTRR